MFIYFPFKYQLQPNLDNVLNIAPFIMKSKVTYDKGQLRSKLYDLLVLMILAGSQTLSQKQLRHAIRKLSCMDYLSRLTHR